MEDIELVVLPGRDFAADRMNRKLLTDGVILVNVMVVIWTDEKLGGVSLSTLKAESLAASEQIRELLTIREMLHKIGMAHGLPMTL